MGLKEDFDAAAEEAKTLPDKVSNDDKLSLYALFKQATVGDVNTDRPGMFDMKGRAKWDAWSKIKGKSSEDAMNEYIHKMVRINTSAFLNTSRSCQNSFFHRINSGKQFSRRQVRVCAFADEKTVSVKFTVPFNTQFGEHLKIVGSTSELGSWLPTQGLLMDWTEGNVWVAYVDLPADTSFDFKIVHCKPDQIIWEERSNRQLALSDSSQALTLSWGSEEDYSFSTTTTSATTTTTEDVETGNADGITPPFSSIIIEESSTSIPAETIAAVDIPEIAAKEEDGSFLELESQPLLDDEIFIEEQEESSEVREDESKPSLPSKNTFVNGAMKTAGAVALGVAGAAVLSALAIDVADTAILGAVAAAAGGAILSNNPSTKKSLGGEDEEGVLPADEDKEMEPRITGAGQPGVAIAAGILSAFDAGKSLVKALDSREEKEEE